MNNTDEQGAMPGWRQKANDFSSRFRDKEKKESRRRGEYIWAILWAIFFLWVVNKVPDWDLKFITKSYHSVLPILNINIFIQIAGNILMLLFMVPRLRHFIKAVIDASSFVALIVIYTFYPFDFGATGHGWLDSILPWILIISLIVTGISVVVHLIKTIFSSH